MSYLGLQRDFALSGFMYYCTRNHDKHLKIIYNNDFDVNKIKICNLLKENHRESDGILHFQLSLVSAFGDGKVCVRLLS